MRKVYLCVGSKQPYRENEDDSYNDRRIFWSLMYTSESLHGEYSCFFIDDVTENYLITNIEENRNGLLKEIKKGSVNAFQDSYGVIHETSDTNGKLFYLFEVDGEYWDAITGELGSYLDDYVDIPEPVRQFLYQVYSYAIKKLG